MVINLLLAFVWGILAAASYFDWSRTGSWVGLALVAVNGLVAALALVRRPSQRTSPEPRLWLLGGVGTFIPLFFRPAALPPAVAWSGVGAIVQAIGMVAMAVALLTLGRSWGIVPANRGLVERGLYRWIRHPLYATELLFHVGVVLAAPTLANAGLWLALLVAQLLRATAEERLLRSDEGYREYLARVRFRFVPGLM